MALARAVDVAADLGDHGRTEGEVWDEMAVPEIGNGVSARVDVHTKDRVAGLTTYMMSTCNQSAPRSMVREHSAPRSAKSAERIDGAMIAFGAIASSSTGCCRGS